MQYIPALADPPSEFVRMAGRPDGTLRETRTSLFRFEGARDDGLEPSKSCSCVAMSIAGARLRTAPARADRS